MFLDLRTDVAQCILTGSKLPSPALERTPRPPTRNLAGKSHEAVTALTQRSRVARLNEGGGTRGRWNMFDTRAQVARAASLERKVEKVLFPCVSGRARAIKNGRFVIEKELVVEGFSLHIHAKFEVVGLISTRARTWLALVLLVRGSCNG